MKTAFKKYLSLIKAKRRFLTTTEAIDFYVENIMKNGSGCKIGAYTNAKEELELWELTNRASMWQRYTIGSMALQGIINIKELNDTQDK